MTAVEDLVLSPVQEHIARRLCVASRGRTAEALIEGTGGTHATVAALVAIGIVEERRCGGRGALYHLTKLGRATVCAQDPDDDHRGRQSTGTTAGTRKEVITMTATAEDTAKNDVTPDPKPEPTAKKGRRSPAKPAAEVPEVKDVTGQAPEPKPSKTKTAKDNAVAVLKKAGKALTVAEIMADPSMAGINKSTVGVQLGVAVKEKLVKRTGRATYQAK